MSALSTARQFFDKLVAGGGSEIERLVVDQVHETEWLDFKSGEHLDDDKATWSEAVCGFANNQGGVLVWGIDARKDKQTGVDAACDVKPVPNPAALRSRLLELLRGAVEPPVAGVEVRDISQQGSSGPGFVVCYVPESDSKPHRAELLTNKPYKIRIADAFINPSVSLLRSLFFPRSSPRLDVEVMPTWIPIPNEVEPAPRTIEMRYEVRLKNSGLVTAKDIFVIISTEPPGMQIDAPYKAEKSRTEFGEGVVHPRPLHPSSNCAFCHVKHNVGAGQSSGPVRYTPWIERPCVLKFDVFADDMAPRKLVAKIGEFEILTKQPVDAVPRT
jgi:Schlafen, AlbA_2